MKKIKPRHIFCIISLVIIFIGYFIFLCNYTNRYTVMQLLEGTVDLENVRVEVSDKEILEVESIKPGVYNNILGFLFVNLKSSV